MLKIPKRLTLSQLETQKRVTNPRWKAAVGAASEQTRDKALQRAYDMLQRIAPGQSGRSVGNRPVILDSTKLHRSCLSMTPHDSGTRRILV